MSNKDIYLGAGDAGVCFPPLPFPHNTTSFLYFSQSLLNGELASSLESRDRWAETKLLH